MQTGSALSCQQYLCGGARLASTPESSPPSLFFQCLQQACSPPIQPHSWASRPPGAKEDFCWRRQEGARGKERHRGALAESFGRKISFFAALLCFMELQEPTMCNKLIQNVQLKNYFWYLNYIHMYAIASKKLHQIQMIHTFLAVGVIFCLLYLHLCKSSLP